MNKLLSYFKKFDEWMGDDKFHLRVGYIPDDVLRDSMDDRNAQIRQIVEENKLLKQQLREKKMIEANYRLIEDKDE